MSQNHLPNSPLNKSTRDALAKDVIASLEETLTIIRTYFSTCGENVYSFDFLIHLPAEGPSRISFAGPTKPSREVSNHNRLQALEMVTTATKSFARAEQALRRLFPQQAFHIGLDKHDPDKIYLQLGEGHLKNRGDFNAIIKTVLKRWKSQLIRLSHFFAASEEHEDNGDIQRFFLYKTIKVETSSGQDTLNPLLVDARSLTQALHFSSFSNASAATPSPKTCSTKFAAKLTDKMTSESFQDKFRSIADFEIKCRQDWIDEQTKKGTPLIKQVLEDILSLSEICTTTLSCNILTGKIKIKCIDTLHIHPDDLARKAPLVETLRADVVKLSCYLKETLLEVHPHIHQAHFTKHVKLNHSGRLDVENMHFVLDLLPVVITQNHHNLIEAAIDLAQMVDPQKWGDLQRFALLSSKNDNINLVNNSVYAGHVNATSLAHAARLIPLAKNLKSSICKIEPIAQSEINAAHCATSNSAEAHFNTIFFT